MTAIILAGGKSSRFGRAKAFLRVNHEPLIKRQLRLLKKIFKQIIIVSNSSKEYRNLKGVRVVPDIVAHLGPLGGIYSGLSASKSFYNFVIACDMPFINSELIKYMLNSKSGFDVVVPRTKKGYEALFAIYSKSCIKPISKILNTDNLRIRQIFSKIKLKQIKEQEILKFGDPSALFMNINTKEDLCKISTYLKK